MRFIFPEEDNILSAKLVTLMVCERVLKDVIDSNKLSFIGVFTGFRTAVLPFMNPPLFLVARYSLGQGEFSHHFEIQHSSGEALFKSPPNSFFLDNRTSIHTDIAGVEGVLFAHPGQYWIKSFLRGEEMGRVPLELNYNPPKVINEPKH